MNLCGGGVSCGGDDDGEKGCHKLMVLIIHSIITAGDVVYNDYDQVLGCTL